MPASYPSDRRIRRCHWCIRSRTGATTSVATRPRHGGQRHLRLAGPRRHDDDAAAAGLLPRPHRLLLLRPKRYVRSLRPGDPRRRPDAIANRRPIAQQVRSDVAIVDGVRPQAPDAGIERPAGPRRPGPAREQGATIESEFNNREGHRRDVTEMSAQKRTPRLLRGSRGVRCLTAGGDLLSRWRSIIGPAGLTAVFGMGTGVAPRVWPPTKARRPLGGPAGRWFKRRVEVQGSGIRPFCWSNTDFGELLDPLHSPCRSSARRDGGR